MCIMKDVSGVDRVGKLHSPKVDTWRSTRTRNLCNGPNDSVMQCTLWDKQHVNLQFWLP